ncbi:Threonine/homoserine/homoserine lactone efflux protein [Abditibacterium utsteinense]|uniref:Threonine/homoserine/homoserine lactone efflux protein n=1 Tax=Abditibacterium utsteinense TaxID=1960156 RepID=A0A2S8SUS4_9BACT|nr:LysE family translocator [Abditibacterium utsteinense]PQV64541.1 Threonine/homoserine/homoserine lactone efflux protein [Abditibacterium utsteinense]
MPFDYSTYALFCAGAFALILSPGPDFFYVATRGIAGGRGAGVVSAFGIGAGLVVHTVLAASGLTLLLLASPGVFNLVKWIGAAYLIFIGIKLLRAGDEFLAPVEKRDFKLAAVFRQGVLTNVLNPKVALTFAAFVLPFVHSERGNATTQILILGATLCVLATSWFCFIGFFAGNLGQLLGNHPKIGRGVRLFSGLALALLGVKLALGQRP